MCTSGSFSGAGDCPIVNCVRRLSLIGEAFPQMKNPYEVLRAKEQELIRIRKEMDALRIAVRLLGAEDKGAAANGEGQPQLTRVVEMP